MMSWMMMNKWVKGNTRGRGRGILWAWMPVCYLAGATPPVLPPLALEGVQSPHLLQLQYSRVERRAVRRAWCAFGGTFSIGVLPIITTQMKK